MWGIEGIAALIRNLCTR